MTLFDKAYQHVQVLVNTFNSNYNHYMSPTYSEAEARQDFIDNFFIALGWDVLHKQQTNPYQQEVKIERSQKQQNESARKRADYAFFTAPNFKDEVFFAEAKKPSVLIQSNPQHYFQTIKYGWNSGCPICVLTDFEEFAIIDCRQKPDLKYALNGKHKTYSYKDYANKEKFAEIYWLFSREAVGNNSLQNYANSLPKAKGKTVKKALFKGGYQAIDDSFLEYIDGIRENIAKAFKKANDNLNSEQLTEATQRTVDRLVFIRFLEDKFIEAAEHVSEWQSWADFISDCRKLDAKYNGVVFKKHFIDEPHFLGADEKLFLDICSDISNLNSPYDFNYIPIHILGSIYERFLGKIVRATDKRVFIEEKPEVRKAGGVYYTPKYIVDYIVQHTVGKIIEGLTPAQIAEKHIADIACGSGSFLIGVYDSLLDYHKKYYTQKLQGKTEIDKRSEDYGNVEYIDGQWRLTLKLKQDILLNNIYGVDIDAQAVEVTQLSLFLKMLDEENVSSTATKQGALFSKVLPDLSKNIVCGNSLIGFDIMNGQLFEDAELKKLNPMDYETAFPKIMRNGGFDAVVGNPPYVKEDVAAKIFHSVKNSYLKKYYQGKMDLWYFFLCNGIDLLKPNGRIAFIAPNNWITSAGASLTRKKVVEETIIESFFDFNDFKVFKDASIQTACFVINKTAPSSEYFVLYKKLIVKYCEEINLRNNLLENKETNEVESYQAYLNPFNSAGNSITFNNQIRKKLLDKIIESSNFRLEEKEVGNGIDVLQDFVSKTNLEKLNDTTINKGDGVFVLTTTELENLNLSDEELQICKPYFTSEKLTRFNWDSKNFYWIVYADEKFRKNISQFPNLKKHLDKFKKIMTSAFKPYGLHRAREQKYFEGEKIFSLRKTKRVSFTYTDNSCYVSRAFLIIKSERINQKYLTGVLNSNLINFWLYEKGKKQGEQLQIDKEPLLQIPIHLTPDKQQHDKLVDLVTQMLSSKKQLAAANSSPKEMTSFQKMSSLPPTLTTDSDKNFLQNKCNSIDRQIDNLVYALYGLSEEEIKIVEGN